MITQDYKDINDIDKLHNIIQSHESQINILQEQIKSLTDKIYGRKTEKVILSPYQQLPLPENLPRVEVIHDLKEQDKLCKCGCLKSRIGEEISEQLDYIPARVQVIKNIRYKYACKNCEGTEDDGPTVSIARMPEQIIPKSIATPGLLAHILTAKFADALPFSA